MSSPISTFSFALFVRYWWRTAPPDCRRVFLLCLLLPLLCAQAHGATYFVSESQGNDFNPGTSAAAAWRTLAKTLSTTLQPGDSVLLRRGDRWGETLIVRDSGAPGNPIRYGAYGEGANPVLDGSDPFLSLSILGGGKFRMITAAPVELFLVDGVLGRRVASEAAVLTNGDWFYAAGAVTFRAANTPTTVRATVRQFGIVMNLVRDVTLEDIEVRHAYDPVWVFNTQRVVFQRMRVSDCAGFAGFFLAAEVPGYGTQNTIRDCVVQGITGSAASVGFANDGTGIFVFGTGQSSANTIVNCQVSQCGNEGIAVLNGSTHVIRGNEVTGCASAGIRIVGSDSHDNVIESNTVYGNCGGQDDRFGIDLLDVGNDNVVRYNLVRQQLIAPGAVFKSGGIRFDGGDFTADQNQTSAGNTAYYNVVYDEFIGINCFNVSNVSVRNNTVVDCDSYAIAIHAVSNAVPENNVALNNIIRDQSGEVFFNNGVADTLVNFNFYECAPNAKFVFDNAFFTYDTWRSNVGHDAQGARGALRLVAPAALDFRLEADSIAVNAGTPVGLTRDFANTPVPQQGVVDGGAFEHVAFVVPEGEGEGEGVGQLPAVHAADQNEDLIISLSELLRVVQLFNLRDFRCNPGVEDGFAPGVAPRDCAPHSSDYAPQNWRISLAELLRLLQLFAAASYTPQPGSEDGFAPVL